MILHKIAPLFILLLVSTTLPAKKMGMEISYTEFMDASDQAFLELSFALGAQSVDYMKDASGKYIGGVEVTVSLKQGDKIVAADKFRLLSPPLDDTTGLPEAFIHQLRFEVEKGEYMLLIDLQDIHEIEEKYHLEQKVTTTLGGSELATSDIQFLDSYKKSSSESVFSKSGFDLIPLVSSGSYVFNENVKTISFYSEIYNTKEAFGGETPYVIKYFIKDTDRDKVLDEYASFSRKEASDAEPVLANFSIEGLKTGNYELVLQVLNKDGEVSAKRSKFFYRINNSVPTISLDEMDEQDITSSFVYQLGGMDSLYQYIKYLWPISSDAEQRYQKDLLEERDLKRMRQYFYAFWSSRNEQNPEAQWTRYHEEVKIANRHYDSRLRPGYMSDRGRVFLTYGRPDAIDRRVMEPNMPNYQIWQYNLINTPYVAKQTNRMFVFAEFQHSANDYQLFHSTAIGELEMGNWRDVMRVRHNGGTTFPIDRFGTRLEDNIILDGSGSDRENR